MPNKNGLLTVGIVVDPAGTGMGTALGEISYNLTLLKLLGLPCKLKKSSMQGMVGMNERFDLLVIDYGGLSDNSAAVDHVRAACEWAEDHPGSLLLIWTWHTWQLYHSELRFEFSHLNNVLFFSPTGVENAFAMADIQNKHEHEIIDEICNWFQVPRGPVLLFGEEEFGPLTAPPELP